MQCMLKIDCTRFMQSLFLSTLHQNKQLPLERKQALRLAGRAGAQREYDIFTQIHQKKRYRNFSRRFR